MKTIFTFGFRSILSPRTDRHPRPYTLTTAILSTNKSVTMVHCPTTCRTIVVPSAVHDPVIVFQTFPPVVSANCFALPYTSFETMRSARQPELLTRRLKAALMVYVAPGMTV